MNPIDKIKNPYVRRTVVILTLPLGAVLCLGIVLWEAGVEYARMVAGTPSEFKRMWRGE